MKELVHESGRKIEEIADECEVGVSYIYDLMSGRRGNPSHWIISRLAKSLKCSQKVVRARIAKSAKAYGNRKANRSA